MDDDQSEELDMLLAEHGISDEPVALMANHSIGGRDWELEEGVKPLFFEDSYFRPSGWYVLREQDVSYLGASSATSGSTCRAWKNQDDTWNIECEVPIEDGGTPYRGAYYSGFVTALGGLDLEGAPPT